VLVIILIYSWVLSHTRTGRYIYAVGNNPEAARRAGINVKWIVTFGFIMAGASLRHVPLTPGTDFMRELKQAVVHSVPPPVALIGQTWLLPASKGPLPACGRGVTADGQGCETPVVLRHVIIIDGRAG